jgi:guanosine-3',5'-bis(diphosphate) 3'-pyrophosphohydrolase
MELNQLTSINIVSASAAGAHNGMTRKDKNTPYIVHPARVANLVTYFGGDHIAIISAWVHDVFEDCDSRTITEVRKTINLLPLPITERRKIHKIAAALTKNSNLPKDQRMADSLNRILKAPDEAILIKICDRIDNLIDAQTRDKEFKDKYGNEAKLIARTLSKVARDAGYSNALKELEKIITKVC